MLFHFVKRDDCAWKSQFHQRFAVSEIFKPACILNNNNNYGLWSPSIWCNVAQFCGRQHSPQNSRSAPWTMAVWELVANLVEFFFYGVLTEHIKMQKCWLRIIFPHVAPLRSLYITTTAFLEKNIEGAEALCSCPGIDMDPIIQHKLLKQRTFVWKLTKDLMQHSKWMCRNSGSGCHLFSSLRWPLLMTILNILPRVRTGRKLNDLCLERFSRPSNIKFQHSEKLWGLKTWDLGQCWSHTHLHSVLDR